jgi:hypothetical protein
MRVLLFSMIVLLTAGCVTPKVGMTMAEYGAQCRFATWREPTAISVSSGETVLQCSGTNYQVFDRTGVLQKVLSEEEVVALIEDDKCKSFGLLPGNQAYVNCRLVLAQIRAQQETVAHARQQQAAQALMSYSLMLQRINQPQTLNIQANCTSHQVGTYTSYSCQ